MTETYCGKSCAACTRKELLNCPGCQAGPGWKYGGDCDLAACCREKGHETCATCGLREGCATFQSRDRQPEYRRLRNEAQKRQKAIRADRALFLGKWLWILFWLVVPATIADIMGNEHVRSAAPGVYLTGQIMGFACSAAYGVILLKLSPAEKRYRTAGVCSLIGSAVIVLGVILFGEGAESAGAQLLNLLAAVVGMIGTYHEYSAHASVLLGVNNSLSEKWTTLWKWVVGCTLGMLGSVLLVALAPVLGLIVFVAASIGIVVVGIVKLVYLYRTAKAFRGISLQSAVYRDNDY